MNSFMAGPSMMAYYRDRETAAQAPSPTAPYAQPMARRPAASPDAKPKQKPKELRLPVVNRELYMHRRNSSKEARGTFRLINILGRKFYFSTDFWIGAIPMGITVILIMANMALVWEEVGWREYIFTLFMLAATFSSYFLTTTGDPGIYPRLCTGEKDPLEDNMQLVFCRNCRLRRPPRCSHCYHCDVCILEHDHHCSVLGGCVGVRNLRWFTLYLLSCCSSTMIGVVWLSRSMYYDLYVEPDADAATTTTPHPTYPNGRRRFPEDGGNTDGRSGKHLLLLLIILLDCIVVTLVGGMLFIYLYLTLTDTTRRESMRKQNSINTLLHPSFVWNNIQKAAHPPPSLLNSDGHGNEETTRLI